MQLVERTERGLAFLQILAQLQCRSTLRKVAGVKPSPSLRGEGPHHHRSAGFVEAAEGGFYVCSDPGGCLGEVQTGRCASLVTAAVRVLEFLHRGVDSFFHAQGVGALARRVILKAL